MDTENCLCKIYAHRFQKVNDCRDIDISAIREKPRWLPKTCAYVLLDEGKPLPAWHPLITGRAASVHEAGVSLQGRKLINESEVTDYEITLLSGKTFDINADLGFDMKVVHSGRSRRLTLRIDKKTVWPF